MANVLIVAYLLIVVALVAVILLQRSEGGGLGMGGGSNGFMSVRGTANVLTRATGILAALFFAAAIGLTLLSGADKSTENIINGAAAPAVAPATATPAGGKAVPAGKAAPSILDQLNAAEGQSAQQSGAVPATPTPASTTPASTAPSSQDAPDLALPSSSATPAAGSTPAATSSTPAPAATTPAAAPAATPTAPAATTPAATPPAASGGTTPATPVQPATN